VHPFYKIGETYRFKYSGLHKTVDLFGRIEAVITLRDMYDQEIKVKPHSWQTRLDEYNPGEITCLVQRFRKGRPVLINIEEKPADIA